jgi:alpha-tubulin suppressor-like RCC1 family protein
MKCPICGSSTIFNDYSGLSLAIKGLPENWKALYLEGFMCLQCGDSTNSFILLKDGRLYIYKDDDVWTLIRNTTPDPKRIGGYKVIQK